MTPEERARVEIDKQLTAAGWLVVDKDQYNPLAATGIAIREATMMTGFADYLLLVDKKAIGVVEAKKTGTTLSQVAEQSAKYAIGLPDYIQSWRPDEPLPFRYESTGVETNFTSTLDPEPRSRPVFSFHQPETLAAWVQEEESLRARLQYRLGETNPLIESDLWPPQIEAIHNLETSLALDRPRALVQMATGSGKTFTTVNQVYRLIKHAKAERVLFLVDRNNLGRQALNAFQTFSTPDDGRKFTELYNVQRLQGSQIDDVSRVVITTIQRLYSILRGEELAGEDEEASLYETYDSQAPPPPKTVSYSKQIPIEFFDFIVVDECHRSIYSIWGQVLDYFDAFLIGLTATPSKLTIGFFKQNLVMEYNHLKAVADGINVPGEVYHIRTRISEDGSTVTVDEAGYYLKVMDRRTRDVRYEEMDKDLEYAAPQLDRAVQSESQIRTIVREFHDRLFTDIFPGRTEVPKTLVFAKDDTHAEKIVQVIREEFGRGNDFCQKITYRVSESKPEDLIASFRTGYMPRIVVTVDMIATGTDVRPIEILLFMRLVKSRNYFEQMRGRGTRVVGKDELRLVTGDAREKDRFVLVDAVGVTEVEPVERTPTLNRKRSETLPKLLAKLVHMDEGSFDPDTIATIADRLARMERKLNETDQDEIAELGDGGSLRNLTHALIDAVDANRIEDQALADGAAEPAADAVSEAELEAAAQKLMAVAAHPLQTNPALRKLLQELYERTEIVLDVVSEDEVVRSAFDEDPEAAARRTIDSFRDYIEANQDEITALEIILAQPYNKRELTFETVKELGERIGGPPNNWTTEGLWRAYQRIEKDRVRGAGAPRVLTDIVALVRHTVRPEDDLLIPYPELVAQRYENWLAEQEAAGRSFTDEQRWWLDNIARHIGVNLAIRPEHLDMGDFFQRGGRGGARRDLGEEWLALLDEMNETLVVL